MSKAGWSRRLNQFLSYEHPSTLWLPVVKFDWFSDSASPDSSEPRPFIRFSEMQFSGTSARRGKMMGRRQLRRLERSSFFRLPAATLNIRFSLTERGESHMFLTSFLARHHNNSPSFRTPLSSILSKRQTRTPHVIK